MLELNLLNPLERNNANKIKIYFVIKYICFHTLSLFIIIALIFSLSVLIVQKDLNSVEQQIENEKQIRKDGNLNSIEDATNQLNNQLQQVKDIQGKYFVWTNFLSTFSGLIPNNINITNVEFNTNFLTTAKDKTFKIEGNAATRNDFILLQSNLTDSKIFTNINAPISNLIQKENIDFIITGNITNEIFI